MIFFCNFSSLRYLKPVKLLVEFYLIAALVNFSTMLNSGLRACEIGGGSSSSAPTNLSILSTTLCPLPSTWQRGKVGDEYILWHVKGYSSTGLKGHLKTYWVIWIFVYSPQYWTSNTSLGSYSCFGQVTGSGESRVNYVVGYVLWPFY